MNYIPIFNSAVSDALSEQMLAIASLYTNILMTPVSYSFEHMLFMPGWHSGLEC